MRNMMGDIYETVTVYPPLARKINNLKVFGKK
jgi:hypothetical protein